MRKKETQKNDPVEAAPLPEEPTTDPVIDAEIDPTAQSPESDTENLSPDTETPEPAPRTEEDEALETRMLRLQADFDNYRKRTLRERSEWQRQAAENVLADLLPVIDHYELGLKTARAQETSASVVDGFQMVYEQFLAALKKHQVTPIAAEGEVFDHNHHEAITYVPSEEHPADVIIAETRRGYKIGDKLLRASQVVVSSGPAEAEAAADNDAAETAS